MPLLILLALAAFFLPFCGPRLDTDLARADYITQSGITSAQVPRNVTGCLDGYAGKTLVTYSGIVLGGGAEPSIDATLSPGCTGGSAPALPVSLGTFATMRIPWQPSIVVAAVALVVALITSVAFRRARRLAVGGLLAVAMVALLVGQGHIETLIIAAAGDNAADAQATAYLSVESGIGYVADLFLLTLALLYVAALEVIRLRVSRFAVSQMGGAA